MSHCTTFKFQYTNRKLVAGAFEKLGLECKDGVVCSYASEYDKRMGVVKSKKSAMIASRDGFNYFMEDYGNHYELSIEKPDMTLDEERRASRLGDEFRKSYIEEAALDFINQMNQKGNMCVLDKTDNSYVIKFGSMYEKNIMIKFENGRVVEEVQGVKGKECASITEALEKMLSSENADLNKEWTSEYYEDSGDGLLIYSLNQF